MLSTVGARAPADVVVPRGADPEKAAGRPARVWIMLLVLGWLAQAGLRAWFSRMQTVPLANPDETAYLISARVLAGGPAIDFSKSTLYQGGYPLLIAPAYWFTSSPVTVYRAVLMINAAVSAGLMPLAYLAGRRLGLGRPAAYGVAGAAALLPAGFFYAEYALSDAIYPVIVLAWLLAVHSWLTASSARGRYAAAAGSALLAGYSYAVHSRGAVIVAGFVVVAVLAGWRRLVPRGTVAAAALALAAAAGGGWLLDRDLSPAIYPRGTRSLSAETEARLHSVHDAINVLEMAAGQMWRFVVDSWGLAGIGLIAAAAVIVRRGTRGDVRIMAALGVAVTLVTAGSAPAALPATTSATWASGRYLDAMIVTFFIVGAAVLLRARARTILGCAACVAALTVLTGVIVAVYAGSSLPVGGFPTAFNFGELAVLTQDWTRAAVWLATAVALGLLATWVLIALAARRWCEVTLAGLVRVRVLARVCLILGIAAVSLMAVAQMTSHISQADTPAEAAMTTGFVTATGLKPGDQIAITAATPGQGYAADDVSSGVWTPQAFQVWWAELETFNPAGQAPPAGTTLVEAGWPAGQPARASWPHAPAGWRIVASNHVDGWVVWRRG